MMASTVICISNKGHLANLVVGNRYDKIEDPKVEEKNLIRIIDDSQESNIYSKDLFQEEV